jgi:hypothetical protein
MEANENKARMERFFFLKFTFKVERKKNIYRISFEVPGLVGMVHVRL